MWSDVQDSPPEPSNKKVYIEDSDEFEAYVATYGVLFAAQLITGRLASKTISSAARVMRCGSTCQKCCQTVVRHPACFIQLLPQFMPCR
jgi:hypothetical protein